MEGNTIIGNDVWIGTEEKRHSIMNDVFHSLFPYKHFYTKLPTPNRASALACN